MRSTRHKGEKVTTTRAKSLAAHAKGSGAIGHRVVKSTGALLAIVLTCLLSACGGGDSAAVTVTVAETAEASDAASVAPGTIADGKYSVPDEVSPGTYRAPDASDGCYWARLRSFSGETSAIIANANESGPALVTIAPTDKGFETSGCGTWSKVGNPTSAQTHNANSALPASFVSSFRRGCLKNTSTGVPRRLMRIGCDCMVRKIEKSFSTEEVLEPGFVQSPRMQRVIKLCIAEALKHR
jgi:hypothetical protein